MAGNPCTKHDSFIEYVFAFLPQLTYYEYRYIPPNSRQEACQKYRLYFNYIVNNIFKYNVDNSQKNIVGLNKGFLKINKEQFTYGKRDFYLHLV